MWRKFQALLALSVPSGSLLRKEIPSKPLQASLCYIAASAEQHDGRQGRVAGPWSAIDRHVADARPAFCAMQAIYQNFAARMQHCSFSRLSLPLTSFCQSSSDLVGSKLVGCLEWMDLSQSAYCSAQVK